MLLPSVHRFDPPTTTIRCLNYLVLEIFISSLLVVLISSKYLLISNNIGYCIMMSDVGCN